VPRKKKKKAPYIYKKKNKEKYQVYIKINRKLIWVGECTKFSNACILYNKTMQPFGGLLKHQRYLKKKTALEKALEQQSQLTAHQEFLEQNS